jgi:DNA-directed RNA polymerase specialized sigma24 family protein
MVQSDLHAAKSRSDDASELPDAEEIVGETCRRILEGSLLGYIWDGVDSFDKFFARCLRTTCSSLRDGERRHVRGQAKFASTFSPVSPPDQDTTIANGQYAPALAAAIAKTSMTGAGVDYAKHQEKWTLREISDDLRVRQATVASLRARLRDNTTFRKALKKPSE